MRRRRWSPRGTPRSRAWPARARRGETMAIWADSRTRCITQGITGEHGARHTKGSAEYAAQFANGGKFVGGVTPGKGGETFDAGAAKLPIFDTVSEAVEKIGANATMIFVPPPFAADAIIEAA